MFDIRGGCVDPGAYKITAVRYFEIIPLANQTDLLLPTKAQSSSINVMDLLPSIVKDT
jgi:hypothetical protein